MIYILFTEQNSKEVFYMENDKIMIGILIMSIDKKWIDL